MRDSKIRIKVERIIGRKLLPGEIIHHKNRDPNDNSLNNLEVLTKEEHKILTFKGKDALRYFRSKNKCQP